MLSDPAIVRRLTERFIPMALDNVDNPNLAPSEREFLKGRGLEFSTQGMSIFTADGRVLAMGGGYDSADVGRMLDEAWTDFHSLPTTPAPEVPPLDQEESAARRTPPKGGLVLHVTWKVVEDYGDPESSPTTGNGHHDASFRHALGADRLWVRQDEVRELSARRNVPASLLHRIARCHLHYIFGAQADPPRTSISGSRINGEFPCATGDAGRLAGDLNVADGTVSSLRILAVGTSTRITDCGFSAGLTVVPTGRPVRVAMLFSLAAPDDELARVLPHRSREANYLD